MIRRFTLKMIFAYQLLVSPIFTGLGAGCRFHPACSEYARVAFQRKSFVDAFVLTLRRILRCGPWNEGGVDEVPE